MAYSRTQLFKFATEPEELVQLNADYDAGQVSHHVIAEHLRYASEPSKYEHGVVLEYFAGSQGGVLAPYQGENGMDVRSDQPPLVGRINRNTAVAKVTLVRRYRPSGNLGDPHVTMIDEAELPLSHELAQTAWNRQANNTTWGSYVASGWSKVTAADEFDDEEERNHRWVTQLQIKVGGRILFNNNEYLTAYDAAQHYQITSGETLYSGTKNFKDQARPAFPAPFSDVEIITGGTYLRFQVHRGNDWWDEAQTGPFTGKVAVVAIPIGYLATGAELTALGLPDAEAWAAENPGPGKDARWSAIVTLPLSELEEIPHEELYPPATVEFETTFDRFLKRINSVGRASGGAVLRTEYRTPDMPSGTWKTGTTPHDLPIYDPDNAPSEVPLRIRFTLQSPNHFIYGWTVSYEEHERIAELDPIVPDLGGVPPDDWAEPSLPYRAVTYSRATLRHPLMPVGMGGVVAYELYGGGKATVNRVGEYLVIGSNHQPPYVVYFDPDNTGQALPAATQDTLEWARSQTDGFPAWGGVERYDEDRNLVYPAYEVLIDDFDYSAYLTEFQPDRVKLTGPPTFNEQQPYAMHQLKVTANDVPVTAGVITRVSGSPHANVRTLDIQTQPTLEYYDVDLSAVDMSDIHLPSTEEEYIDKMLRRAGFSNMIFRTPGVKFREVAFWTKPPPDGPGMVQEEVEAKYWNTQGGSVRGEVEAVVQANNLQIHDLPSGDLLVTPILPLVEKTLLQIVEQDALVYCRDDAGNFVNEPRLNVSSVNLALDEGFAEVEVEGYSNVVDPHYKPAPAPFVQGSGNDAQTRPYADHSIGLFTSNKDFRTPFQERVGGVTRNYFIPEHWMEKIGVPKVINKKEADWGIGGTSVAWSTVEKAKVKDLPNVKRMGSNQALYPDINLAELKTRLGITDDTYVYYALALGLRASWTKGATWRSTVDAAALNDALLRIRPLVGRFDETYVPRWLPDVGARIEAAKALKPRKAKRINNPFVAEIGHNYAVQVPSWVSASDFNKNRVSAANHLATWLTVREFLKTRQVELAFAGAQHWVPGQFIAIARRPEGGEGAPVTRVDVLLVMEMSRADARVGAEAWVKARCAYVGWHDYVTGESHYDMPLGWGASWEI